MTDTDRESLIASLRRDVESLRAIGEPIPEEAIRHYAALLGVPAPELSATIGAWPVCADD